MKATNVAHTCFSAFLLGLRMKPKRRLPIGPSTLRALTMRFLQVFALVGILVPTVSAQAPPEELSKIRKVLGVSEETALLGPNALPVPPIPTGPSIRVCVTTGNAVLVMVHFGLGSKIDVSASSTRWPPSSQMVKFRPRGMVDKREREPPMSGDSRR